MNILVVLTSHDQLGDTGNKTGFWLEEFASPYYHFKDAGVQVSLASPGEANRHWIRRAMNPLFKPMPPVALMLTRLLSMNWQPRLNWLP